MIRGRSELERRGRYVELLESLINPLHPALVQLVKQCLHNVPRQRPITDELLATLQRMKVEVEGEYGIQIRLDMEKLRLAKEVKLKDRRIGELTQLQVSDNNVQRGDVNEVLTRQNDKPCIPVVQPIITISLNVIHHHSIHVSLCRQDMKQSCRR